MGKANKFFARTMAATLSLTALLGATACGGGGGSQEDEDEKSPYTVIRIDHFGGTGADKAIRAAWDRFAKKYEGVTLANGKTGLELKLNNNTGVKIGGMSAKAAHMVYAHSRFSDYLGEMQNGGAMELTDILKADLADYGEPGVTIESKIKPEYLHALKGNDGKYYMLPNDESISGASYDANLFAKYGFYLAKPETYGVEGSDTTEFECAITGQTYYFTSTPANMTVGNDGTPSTDDDGMPTTLNEFVAQCAMISDAGVRVFGAPNNHQDYSNHLVEALWTALAGFDQRSAVSTSEGRVEYVTGQGTEELWAGTGIKKPATEWVTLNKADNGRYGYKAIDQAGRYYAFAFVKLAQSQGWYDQNHQVNGHGYKEAMAAFVLNGLDGRYELASHLEGSYWYNEAEAYGHMQAYKDSLGDQTAVPNIKHWHMPTSVGNDVVTGVANKRTEAITNFMTSGVMLNNDALEAKPVVKEVCIDFLKFLHTDVELQNFSKESGIAKSMFNYTIDDTVYAELDPYQISMMKMRATLPVVYQYGETDVYRNKSAAVSYSANCSGYAPVVGPYTYGSVLQGYVEGKADVWTAFSSTGFSDSKWLEEVYTPATDK